jgi:hypothetical protein
MAGSLASWGGRFGVVVPARPARETARSAGNRAARAARLLALGWSWASPQDGGTGMLVGGTVSVDGRKQCASTSMPSAEPLLGSADGIAVFRFYTDTGALHPVQTVQRMINPS